MKIKCDTDYMIRCLILDSQKTLNRTDFNRINADMVCLEKSEEIEFIHLTYDDCINSIVNEGFRTGDGLLGIGVYVVNPCNQKSLESLINFYTDLCEGCDCMVLVKGKYNGKYLEASYALNENFRYAEGFVLLDDVSKIEIINYNTIPVSDIKNTLIKLGSK